MALQPPTPEELLVQQIAYGANGRWCRVLHSPDDHNVFCRLPRGHKEKTHATHQGAGLLTWAHDQYGEADIFLSPRAN